MTYQNPNAYYPYAIPYNPSYAAPLQVITNQLVSNNAVVPTAPYAISIEQQPTAPPEILSDHQQQETSSKSINQQQQQKQQ